MSISNCLYANDIWFYICWATNVLQIWWRAYITSRGDEVRELFSMPNLYLCDSTDNPKSTVSGSAETSWHAFFNISGFLLSPYSLNNTYWSVLLLAQASKDLSWDYTSCQLGCPTELLQMSLYYWCRSPKICHRGSSCHLRYPSLREEYIRYHHVHSARAQNHELVPGLSHGLQKLHKKLYWYWDWDHRLFTDCGFK